MSTSSYSDFDEEGNWLLDLDTALLENCDFFKLRSICRHRPVPEHLRSDVWKICLNIQKRNDAVESFNDVFDLPNQDLLHQHCREFVASLPKEFFCNSIGFINDIETILTHFSRVYRLAYGENNGWLSILRVLCCELRLTDRRDLYMFFTAICHRFLPSALVLNGDIFSIFRLLVQYHDPELCSFLDTHRISGDMYAMDWFSSLLSSQLPHNVLVQLWDIMFLDSDPFLALYLGLVVVLNLRESLFELRGAERSLIISKIRAVLPLLTVEDIEDFYGLAQHHASLTPRSLAVKFSPVLFGNGHKDSETQWLIDSLCMPISVHELLDSKNGTSATDSRLSVKFFLVDCRPAEQYNAGHLPSAFFLDSGLLLSSPGEEFQMSMSALLVTQQQALEAASESAGEHVCFLGSGVEDEDKLVHMVVAQFLRRHTKYVGMVFGGYKAIHEVLGPQCDQFLTNHDHNVCVVCLTNERREGINKKRGLTNDRKESTNQKRVILNDGLDIDSHEMSVVDIKPMSNLVNKWSSALKVGSSKLKDKMTGIVKQHDAVVVATVDKSRAKTYRDTGNIFSIEDNNNDDDGGSSGNDGVSVVTGHGEHTSPPPEMINLDLWSKRPDVMHTYQCYIVDEDGSLNPGALLLTGTHLYVLKKSASSRLDGLQSLLGLALSSAGANMVTIHRRRTLSHVVKITSKRRIPECLTFHYLVDDNNGTIERDRYVLDEAGDAARVIKIQIQKVLDALEVADCGGGGGATSRAK